MSSIKKAADLFFSKRRYQIFFIFAAVFLLYSHILDFGFTGYDDVLLISKNYGVLSSYKNTGFIFSKDAFLDKKSCFYRPLLLISYMTDIHAGASETVPFVFYLHDIMLHAACCVLLFLVLLRFGISPPRSFALTLLFSFNPLFASAVAWLPGRNDLLLCFFGLAHLLFSMRYFTRGKIPNLMFSSFFLVAALFTKENAVCLPLMVFWLWFIRYKNAEISSGGIKSFSAASVSALLFWAGFWLNADLSRVFSKEMPDLIFRIPDLPYLFVNSFYPFDFGLWHKAMSTSLVWTAAAFLLVAAILKLSRGNRKTAVFGFGWWLVFLMPTLLGLKYYFPHRHYMACVGIVISLSVCDFSGMFSRGFRACFGFLLLCFFCFGSVYYSSYFNGRYNFWNKALEKSNAGEPYVKLGEYYFMNKMPRAEEQCYKKAIETDPLVKYAHLNLGSLYMFQNRRGEAVKEFVKEIELWPEDGNGQIIEYLKKLGVKIDFSTAKRNIRKPRT